jgi:hypothetical protein
MDNSFPTYVHGSHAEVSSETKVNNFVDSILSESKKDDLYIVYARALGATQARLVIVLDCIKRKDTDLYNHIINTYEW